MKTWEALKYLDDGYKVRGKNFVKGDYIWQGAIGEFIYTDSIGVSASYSFNAKSNDDCWEKIEKKLEFSFDEINYAHIRAMKQACPPAEIFGGIFKKELGFTDE